MFRLEENLILYIVLITEKSNFDDKYVKKSFQLVRGSSFRNGSLQNPYSKYEPFPPELLGKPIEEIDQYVYEKVSADFYRND